LGVGRTDLDPGRVRQSLDRQLLLGRGGEAQRVRPRLDAHAHRGVGKRLGEPGHRVELVPPLLVAEPRAAEEDPRVEQEAEDDERHEAAELPLAPPTGRQAHHCDWASFTRSLIRSSSAIRRPSASRPGSYWASAGKVRFLSRSFSLRTSVITMSTVTRSNRLLTSTVLPRVPVPVPDPRKPTGWSGSYRRTVPVTTASACDSATIRRPSRCSTASRTERFTC